MITDTRQANFNVTIDKNMLQIPAEFLQAPNIRYFPKNDQKILLADWNLLKVKFFQPARAVAADSVGIFDFRAISLNIANITASLDREFDKLGMSTVRMDAAKYQHMPRGLEKLDKALVDQIFGLVKWRAKICLVILPDVSKSGYAKVKRVFDIHLGLRSVCVIREKI